ncbi:hypothetical protein B0T16DRAFT_316676 [Cercophora newfieldiana]|uniref:polynucleotide adenylyltransferase n=1 Tax=Cercophora newfieldiana TaxID=92897 RepID=A0AA39YQW9_9PEZI|nr:hypothetical protein B0T16DRAFT_316676 [Cercophora newfieldiana]
MDGRPTTAESKHHYQHNPWPRAPSGSATPRANATSTPESSPGYLPHIELLGLPILFPQQSFQDKLLQYNKLVSAGRGGGGGQPTAPLPPVLSPHSLPATRSRSSSKVSSKDTLHSKPGTQSCHGSRATKTTDIADRAPIASARASTTKMQGKKNSEPTVHHGLPARPPPPSGQNAPLPPAQSSSVPSTPHQHARKFSFESREPSPGATQNHSPRSAYSETNGNVPSLRPLPPRLGGCRFETAIPHSRRRMPYSIGTDKLEKVEPDKIKSCLSEEDEGRLMSDIQELYDQLLPTQEIEIKRKKLVQKLERLFNEEWPGHDIRVHLFGSSGNLLCSDDSDVDICITTAWKELENVCSIADLLDRHGMEKVVCVSSAKVPIVKMWDPELNLACDMNVNNTLALENTRMVRTYVGIDERVRPLAMIIKYWTRRRIVNDAAFGGTLSSYTWICLIIAFLQQRDPPILPALHLHRAKLLKKDGTKSEFADDLDQLRGYGSKNKGSLAALLFHFFRFYAHEFDYDKYALSIRLGKLLTKTEKKWHLGTNNMLCIEEPFNTIRNLGNTADDTSFRGLHIELRRAFDLIAEGKLSECCEQFIFPKEEERIFQKPPPAPRPILVRSSSQQYSGRGRGNGYRGNRQFRNGGSSRRASSSVAYDQNATYAQTGMASAPMLPPQEYIWYQHNPQISHEFLASLSAQDTMRQLWTQQQLNQAALAQHAQNHAQRMQNGAAQSTDRSRTSSFDNPPLSAPLRPEFIYSYGVHVPAGYYHVGQQSFTSYPSSPATTATPEFRRSLHRGTMNSDSGGSGGSGPLRSQSQPASRTPMTPAQPAQGFAATTHKGHAAHIAQGRHVNGVAIPSFMPDDAGDADFDDAPTKPLSDSPPEDDGPRVIGYYVNESSSPIRKVNGFPAPTPALGDLSQGAQGRRRLSTDQLPQSILDRRMKRTSRSPSPLGHARAFSVGTNSAPLTSAPFQVNGKLTPNRGAPLVVNGTMSKPASAPGSVRQPPAAASAPEHMSQEDVGFDNPLYISQGHGFSSPWTEPPIVHPFSAVEPSPPTFPDRPLVVNGSSSGRSPMLAQSAVESSFQHRVAVGGLQSGLPYVPMATDGSSNGVPGFSSPPTNRSRIISRQQQNGIAPLDLATGDFTVAQDIQQHLSPVYEHRTPSPTAVRRFDVPPVAQPHLGLKDHRTEPSRSSQKTPPTGPAPKYDSSSRSPPLDSRTSGVPRENGHVRGIKGQAETANSWQRQKTRKKGVADLKSAANSFAHGEQLPKNDADRKGG